MNFSLGFFIFLSCALNSEYAKATIRENFNLSRILKNQFTNQNEIDCKNDEECQYFIEKSKCVKNLCKCDNDLLLSSDGTKCLKTVQGYGSSCEDNIQCSQKLLAGGICEEKECKCKKGYHYLKGMCWKDSGLNEKCIKNEQCFSSYEYVGFECNAGICKCRTNYYERMNFGCRRKRKIKESCNLDTDCPNGSICDLMTCSGTKEKQNSNETFLKTTFEAGRGNLKCPEGKFSLNGDCVVELGMKCQSNSDCSHISNALCLDGIMCGCEPVTYVASENNKECLRVVRGKNEDITRTSCKKNAQCGVFGGNSLCQNKKCTCNSESYWDKENFVCWPIKKLGESCVRTNDCHPSATNADCLDNICKCKTGFHAKNSVCIKDATEVGHSCEEDEDCLFPNSICSSSNVCACKTTYYPQNGKCVPGVETECETDEDCAHLKNTKCKMGDSSQKQCLCLENHSSSEDHKYCLPDKNFNEYCSETSQCTSILGKFGECINNYCHCQPKAHYTYQKCYESKFIGERCSKLPECFPGNDNNSVICMNGYCSCNYNYEHDGTGICVKTNSGSVLQVYWILFISTVIFSVVKT